jgi:hypothetical protein
MLQNLSQSSKLVEVESSGQEETGNVDDKGLNIELVNEEINVPVSENIIVNTLSDVNACKCLTDIDEVRRRCLPTVTVFFVFSDPNMCCISELSNNSVISDSSTAINNILSSSLSVSLILSASLTGFSVSGLADTKPILFVVFA